MSTDRYRYVAKCLNCGHEGIEVVQSDEGANETSTWTGFITAASDRYLVYRRRVGVTKPLCECGCQDIVRGALLGD